MHPDRPPKFVLPTRIKDCPLPAPADGRPYSHRPSEVGITREHRQISQEFNNVIGALLREFQIAFARSGHGSETDNGGTAACRQEIENAGFKKLFVIFLYRRTVDIEVIKAAGKFIVTILSDRVLPSSGRFYEIRRGANTMAVPPKTASAG
jgi:hypothetical protein